ncbi:hypothetical protein SGUI_2526 [Serinicoccus hydrothermalis]|uniref:Uncharacterized protein n=1 Tax=Serinicoccus hydrothermalis TaxID=1758689 RepID=A0A1B1NER3_9MICO|nr:hypothetical protein [Serinicoccus hydrothermalis]ANS79922.1 hypothetical protein SGUI_2526 [Serinicoccus hydrothermalis]
MSTRSRHEARWTHAEATASGRLPRNAWWMLPLLLGLALLALYGGYRVYMGIDTVTYEVRQCEESLTEQSSWDEVQAAACDPVPAAPVTMALMQGMDRIEPDDVSGSVLTWDAWPVNSPEHSVDLELQDPAQTVVIAEPEAQRVRVELTSDASETMWGGFIGGRGPTSYWVLITPAG